MSFFDKIGDDDVWEKLERITKRDGDKINNPSIAVAVIESGEIVLRFNNTHYVLSNKKALALTELIKKKLNAGDADGLGKSSE